jgi:hypothetical protein
MIVQKIHVVALALLTALLSGCGPAPQRLPDRVNIALIDATIGPGTAQGKAWDGPGTVPIAALQEVSRLLATAPMRGKAEEAAKTGAVIAEITAAIANVLARPDPRGQVELLVGGASRRLLLPERRDTLRPTWQGVSFDQVPLVEGMRLRIQLFDADDIGSDDPIGTAELTHEDIVAALTHEQVVQIRVDQQTQGQLLFVGISVAER